jgi:hypothetical protein
MPKSDASGRYRAGGAAQRDHRVRPGGAGGGLLGGAEEDVGDHRRDLDATVAAVKDRTGLQAVPVASIVSYGHPVKTLIDLAGQHNPLVTGSRGRGRLKGVLLGSVSQNCAQYARGPVVVMRGESSRTTALDGSSSSSTAPLRPSQLCGLPLRRRRCGRLLFTWCMRGARCLSVASRLAVSGRSDTRADT